MTSWKAADSTCACWCRHFTVNFHLLTYNPPTYSLTPAGTATPSAVPLVKHDADDSGLHHRGTAASTEKPALEVVAQTEGASAPTVTATPAAAAPQFKRARIDWLGIITLTVAVICLCLAVVWGGAEYGWSDGRIIALLTIAGVFLCVFITIEAVQVRVIKRQGIAFLMIQLPSPSQLPSTLLWHSSFV